MTDTPPTAEAGWRDFSGTFGLYRQSDSPGDLTRPFLCDADNTRPGQMTAWLRFGATDTVAVDQDSSATNAQTVTQLVNAATGWGFVATATSVITSYWLWNGAKFAVQRGGFGASAASWNNSSRLPPGLTMYASASSPSPPIVQQTGTNLWMAEAAGLQDISVAAAAQVGVANAQHTFVYFDILFVIATSGGNLTITPYRPNTPGAGNVLNSVTYTGLAPALATIPGEFVCLGAVACEGAVYIVTDRSVYGFQWNDLTNTMLTTKLIELPRFTSAPVVWNGEVYIGADNRIVHIVPGQRGYDWRVPDAMGNAPAPFNGMIVQLLAFSDALIAQVTDPLGTGGHCYLRMDSNGIWSCLYHQVTNWGGVASNAASGPMLPIVDGTNPQAIAFPNPASAASFSTMFVCPVPQTSRNPRSLATTARKQRPGPFRIITPWYDLESETAQKQLERFRTAVLMASTATPIKVNYQTDYTDEQGADTFTSGCAKGSGTWHPCGFLGTSSTGNSGSTDASGNGAVWWEYDGTTSYPNSVGVLPRYPTYKRVRWCLEINGDTTGTTVPTLLSHAFHRLEYVTKAYERDITIRLRVNELQGTSQRGPTTVTYANNAAIKAARDALRALNSAKTVCTYVDEWGDSHTVVITKYQVSITALDGNGLPSEYICNLSLMDVPLVGQN